MAINEKEFNYNLTKAISWTNNLSKNFDYESGFYGSVFRRTNPIINGHFLYQMDSDYVAWNINDCELSNYKEALEQLLKLREGTKSWCFDNLANLGSVLSFEIGLSTNDGITIAESHCFFDESDVPPIDTWFYLENRSYTNVNSKLYCWIPKLFVPIVEQAMRCEIMGCYAWYS